jgi:anaerobic dimethyl sulfoxide reductase subunit B
MTYAFVFDSSSCSGCKACQVACKDKNNLPPGVLWRRVYEISGGSWAQEGDAWTNTVFAYNVSIACNHCVHPKCAGVCPTGAYDVRPDGIILINAQKCIGCGYCTWACPYDVPRIDKTSGIVSKCNFCYDNLDHGIPPACVSACPMRCLEFMEVGEQSTSDLGLKLWKIPAIDHPFPLPSLSRTEPHLVFKEHPAAEKGEGTALVANREETSPGSPKVLAAREVPLVFFTLLTQMAIGALWAILAVYSLLMDASLASQVTGLPLLAVGLTVLTGLFVSFFHLGKPQGSWRVINHLDKSWLSREVLSISGFTGLWLLLESFRLIKGIPPAMWTSAAVLAALLGLFGLYCMARIYKLRIVPAWNINRTFLEFLATTVALGSLLAGNLLPEKIQSRVPGLFEAASGIALSISLVICLTTITTSAKKWSVWRVCFILAGFIGLASFLFLPPTLWRGLLIVLLIIVFMEEGIGRWLFYGRRGPGI